MPWLLLSQRAVLLSAGFVCLGGSIFPPLCVFLSFYCFYLSTWLFGWIHLSTSQHYFSSPPEFCYIWAWVDHQRCALAPRCEGGPSGQSCPSARVVLGEGGPLGCLLPVLNCPQPTQLTVSQLGKGGTSSPEPQPTASSSQAIYFVVPNWVVNVRYRDLFDGINWSLSLFWFCLPLL